MITASKLAGYFAAHAIWTLSESDTFSPIFAYTDADGARQMERLIGSKVSEAVAYGKQKLEGNEMDADDAVLVFDGRIPISDEMVDAVMIEMRAYFSPDSEAVIAVPYTPQSSGQFHVHKPKLLVWKECEDFDISSTVASFFEGVQEHKEGADVWNASLDESK